MTPLVLVPPWGGVRRTGESVPPAGVEHPLKLTSTHSQRQQRAATLGRGPLSGKTVHGEGPRRNVVWHGLRSSTPSTGSVRARSGPPGPAAPTAIEV
jgi:hypothetical protein